MKFVKFSKHAALALLIIGTNNATAQDMFIYPNGGQSKEQQEQDRFQCHTWAVEQTGFNPMTASVDAGNKPQEKKGGHLRGAARGALVGTAVGAIAGKDIGTSAAIGAGAGTLRTGLKNRRQNKSNDEAYQANIETQLAEQETQRKSYNRALTACMEGRDYTIK